MSWPVSGSSVFYSASSQVPTSVPQPFSSVSSSAHAGGSLVLNGSGMVYQSFKPWYRSWDVKETRWFFWEMGSSATTWTEPPMAAILIDHSTNTIVDRVTGLAGSQQYSESSLELGPSRMSGGQLQSYITGYTAGIYSDANAAGASLNGARTQPEGDYSADYKFGGYRSGPRPVNPVAKFEASQALAADAANGTGMVVTMGKLDKQAKKHGMRAAKKATGPSSATPAESSDPSLTTEPSSPDAVS